MLGEVPRRWDPLDVPDEAMGDSKVVLVGPRSGSRRTRLNPFFLGVGFFRPHTPI